VVDRFTTPASSCRLVEDPVRRQRPLARSDPTVAAFERWTRARLAEPISIPNAAKSIGVSERILQRCVQRTLGTSPIRFVQDLRIERASHLLRTTGLSLETIARKVGYEP
jgi:transcriptional regulator GlxA family with amidase domain